MSVPRLQRTLRQAAAVEGFGYFSGLDIRVEFQPAPAGAGITFVRRDLSDRRIPVSHTARIDVPRRTTLQCQDAQVEMVEHVLATLAGLGIDNCDVVVDAAEMPGCDGSSQAFVEAIDAAGICEQSAPVQRVHVDQVIRVGDAENWIEARPATGDRLSIAFELDFGADTPVGRQSFAVVVDPDSFRRELAPCRTFLLEAEAKAMLAQGVGKRVTTQNLLIFGPQGPIENSLRFDNECVRHKVLDVVGDLALTGREVVADVVAYRSGHRLHAALAAEIMRHTAENNKQESGRTVAA